jgi:hypothetical protein
LNVFVFTDEKSDQKISRRIKLLKEGMKKPTYDTICVGFSYHHSYGKITGY